MKSILIPMVCLAILVPLHSVAEPGDTELISILADAPLVSTDPNGAADTSGGSGSLISASGRFVAFSSGASNLVPADTNRHMDVFVRDRATGATTRESVSSSGRQMYTTSFVDSVSGDGRYVSFSSQAQNLVPGDTNATTDVFLRDRATGTTRRVSLDSSGLQANGGSYMSVISRSGRYVAFRSSASNLVSGDTNGADDVFVHDQLSGTTERVSVGHAGQANQGSGQPSMSADGRYVAFVSAASNLVPGDTNARGDAFVRDRVAGTTSRISVDSTGAQSNSNTEEAVISDDGRFVAFSGGPGTRLLIRDRTAGVTIDPGLVGFGPGLSTDGRYMVFQSSSALVSDDSNAGEDIYLFDRMSRGIERVSVSSAGEQGNNTSYRPSVSADGTIVSFHSYASNLVAGDTNGLPDLFVRDRISGLTQRIDAEPRSIYVGSRGSLFRTGNTISADGRYVAFTSGAPNLVTGEANDVTNLFVRDRIAGTTTQINLDSSGRPGTADVDEPAISADGRHVAFTSFDDGLVDDDTNHSADVLVHDLGTGVTTRVSVNSAGEGGDSESWAPFISADGRYVAFRSLSRNLVENQFSAGSYLHDRVTGITTRVSGGATTLWISANNRYVASTDFHVSVFDRATGTTTIADVGSQGQLADRGSGSVSLSADGRYVAFSSAATNLVAGDDNGHTDIFVRDIAAGTTTRAAGGNGDSDHVTISADGRLISFVSAAGDLVPGDTNGAADVFVVDRHTRVVQRVSVGSDGTQANGGTETASLAAGGRFVVFVSDATNLTPATPDTNDSLDVYVHELAAASVAEAFQQAAGGMVSMEAEHFDAALPGAELAPWAVVEGLRSSGGAAIRADRAWPRTTSVVESPRNEYRVDFRYAGPHYVWVRARAYRPQSDAFYVGLDDGPLQVRHVEPDDFQWVWIRAWRTIDVDSVGIHTFRLYRGERSVWVDKILITPWPGFSPKWSGPPESPRAG